MSQAPTQPKFHILEANADLVLSVSGDLVLVQLQLGHEDYSSKIEIDFKDEHSSVAIIGLTFATAGQKTQNSVKVTHNLPHCKSRVSYRTALAGKGTETSWVGDVVISANGLATDTYEYNRNLLLTKGAKANSVPNLEILTGDIVGAGHASANGRLDDEQLFYLTSRGLDRGAALRLAIRGFFGAELDQLSEFIGPEGIADVYEKIEARIKEV